MGDGCTVVPHANFSSSFQWWIPSGSISTPSSKVCPIFSSYVDHFNPDHTHIMVNFIISLRVRCIKYITADISPQILLYLAPHPNFSSSFQWCIAQGSIPTPSSKVWWYVDPSYISANHTKFSTTDISPPIFPHTLNSPPQILFLVTSQFSYNIGET